MGFGVYLWNLFLHQADKRARSLTEKHIVESAHQALGILPGRVLLKTGLLQANAL